MKKDKIIKITPDLKDKTLAKKKKIKRIINLKTKPKKNLLHQQ